MNKIYFFLSIIITCVSNIFGRGQYETDTVKTKVGDLTMTFLGHGTLMFTYNNITIHNQRTRWGSCSPNNNISLNMKLVRLPDDLIDYVILHELVHTRIKNHSKKFWDELNVYICDAKKLERRLKEYGVGLL